jgi:DNA repair exonuclease SbcCD ATPase subunit/DNA repair exonuclease SbcCD nuclease subunit
MNLFKRIEKLNQIFHISDIHIRVLSRHQEYREVFNRLFQEIEKTDPDCLVVVAGDIVHAKLETSAELFNEVNYFLKNLADRRSTLVIPGNHDFNLYNLHRKDVVGAVVNSLGHENLYYSTATERFYIGGAEFTHWSILDNKDQYQRTSTWAATKILLYHAPVQNSTTDIGFVLNGNYFTIQDMESYDVVLLGDIHKQQELRSKNTIAVYPSSLIQQDHSEHPLKHGYCLWDLNSKTYQFHAVPNDYGYVTVQLDKDGLSIPKYMPKKPKIRLKYSDVELTEIKSAIAELKAAHHIQHLSLMRQSSSKSSVKNFIEISENVSDTKVQERLIKKYIEDKPELQLQIDELLKLNLEINTMIPPNENLYNITWRPIRFEWNNMFSYGEGNSIDFQNLNSVVGLFAPNAAGKSTFLDSLLFCCFDKTSRTSKSTDILNVKRKNFSCRFEFEIDDERYFIERTGQYANAKTFRVAVEFWKIDAAGQTISLNGDQRRDTNNKIRQYLGEYDDFVMTLFSQQKDNSNFIDKRQSERKDILSRFLNLDVFDKAHAIANEEYKKLNVIVSEYRKTDHDYEIELSQQRIAKIDTVIQQVNSARSEKITEVEELEQQVNELNRCIITNVQAIDVDQQQNIIAQCQAKSSKCQNSIDQLDKEIAEADEQIKRLSRIVDSASDETLPAKVKTYHDALTQSQNVRHALNLISATLQEKEKIDKNFESYEYDPNCKYCISNPFVQSALANKTELQTLQQQQYDLTEELTVWQKQVADHKQFVEQDELHRSSTKQLQQINIKRNSLESKLQLSQQELKSIELKQQAAEREIDIYENHKLELQKNQKIHQEISILNDHIRTVRAEIERYQQMLLKAHSERGTHENQIKKSKEYIEKIQNLENRYKLLQNYLSITDKNGLPYYLIQQITPIIEQEVNQILLKLSNFNINIECNGSDIDIYLQYSEEDVWPVELISGMERFLVSLSFRVALSNLSSLPKSNFLVIDEGFGVLDSENLNAIQQLFDFLSTQYDFLIVVSHIEYMKDFAASQIVIQKEQGFSKMKHG